MQYKLCFILIIVLYAGTVRLHTISRYELTQRTGNTRTCPVPGRRLSGSRDMRRSEVSNYPFALLPL